MPLTTGSGPAIYYETMGPADGMPALLIQGFSAQMIGWRDGFCEALVDRGFRVICFDNRDVGLSEKFGGPDVIDGGYSLTDMAGDGFRVLDTLGLAGAHIVAQSMGGMIAQIMADTQPERVASMSLIYTAPGLEQRHFVPSTDAGVVPNLPRLAREQAIEAFFLGEQAGKSTAYPFNEAWIRELGARSFDRCYAPEGIVRQWHAIMRSPASFADLESLTMPVAVIHGRADGVVNPLAGIEIASRIAHAELHLYPGMGHEIVEPLWGEFADIIRRTALRAAP